MASGLEALGTAAAFLELAKAGIELAKVINQFVEARSRIKSLIQEIELVSAVLGLLSSVFEQEAKDQVCSAEALEAANNIGTAFRTVLDKLRPAVNRHLTGRTGPDGSNTISVRAIMTWPVREVKISTLLASLERIESNANLMLQVITLARLSRPMTTAPYPLHSLIAKGHMTIISEPSIADPQKTSLDSIPYSYHQTAQELMSTTIRSSTISQGSCIQQVPHSSAPETSSAIADLDATQSATQQDPSINHLSTQAHITPFTHASVPQRQETSSDPEDYWLAPEQQTSSDSEESCYIEEPESVPKSFSPKRDQQFYSSASPYLQQIRRDSLRHNSPHSNTQVSQPEISQPMSANTRPVPERYTISELRPPHRLPARRNDEVFRRSVPSSSGPWSHSAQQASFSMPTESARKPTNQLRSTQTLDSVRSRGKEQATTIPTSAGLAEGPVHSKGNGDTDMSASRPRSLSIHHSESTAGLQHVDIVEEVDEQISEDAEFDLLGYEALEFGELVSRWTRQG